LANLGIPTVQIQAVAAVLLAIGLWLLLPRGGHRGRAGGIVLVAIALGLFATGLPRIGDWASQAVFGVFAGVTVVAAVGTITLRNPVYCAIWFGMTLLGTAGLFLIQGAQFLGLATVVVYAGAILVTFLFVLMLANPRGHAVYDRLSWETLWSAAAGALMLLMLSLVIGGLWQSGDQGGATPITPEARAENILAEAHVAHLGKHLFSEHLIVVEIAGTLLLIALVAATAIMAHEKPAVKPRQG